MKDKKILLAVLLTSVFLIITGITYAYFSLVVSGNDVAETINVSTTKIELIYTDGNEIKVDSIEPKWTTTKTITVENTGNEEAYYALGWQKLYNEIQKEELVIRSTCTSTGATGGTCSNTDNVVIPQTSEVTAETNKVINPYKENVKILPGEKHIYTVTIEFINYDDKAQNYNQGKRFYGVLGAAESSKIITLSDMCKDTTLASCLKDNYELAGLTKIDQTATGNQTYATTEYRYQGGSGCVGLVMTSDICTSIGGSLLIGDACFTSSYQLIDITPSICNNNGGNWKDNSPSNYITFNDETGKWRIIGVFEVETLNEDGTYTRENKVKIVRDSIGLFAWDTENKNDWTNATIMTTLNSGDYYNRTGTYESNGLTTKAKSQISSTKWYLGNLIWNNGYGNIKDIYAQERSTSVHSGNKQTWDGKVALIYPSDYMYASSSCYNNDSLIAFDIGTCQHGSTCDTDYRSDACKTTNWLYVVRRSAFTLSPDSNNVNQVAAIDGYGNLTVGAAQESSIYGLRQSLYLDSNVKYVSGDGSTSDPFVIE